MGKSGIFILGRLAPNFIETLSSNYDKFVLETRESIISILEKHKDEIGNDLNFVNAIYEICFSMTQQSLINNLTSSKLIHLLIQIMNKNAAFNLIKYALVSHNSLYFID